MTAAESTGRLSPAEDRRTAWLGLISGSRRGLTAELARSGLLVLAGVYRVALAIANVRFLLPGGARRAPVPVVSVGNLTVGGTGKTPMVAHLVRLAVEMDARPLLVSRGYGAAEGGPADEALLLEHLCPGVPHVQDADRLRAIRQWTSREARDLAILDDGFQHRRLARDLDVVLVDALRPFGFGHVLPRGLLREPATALRRADLVVITRADLVESAALEVTKREVRDRSRPGTPILLARHRPTAIVGLDGMKEPPERLSGQAVAAACGTGHPEAFRRTLEALGARVEMWETFPDHHAYTRGDLESLLQRAEAAGAKTLVTTAKDYVKWRRLLKEADTRRGVRVASLEIEMDVFEGQKMLRREVGRLLGR